MRSGGKGVKILPRVLFEGWSVNDYMALFASERMMQEVAEFITQSIDVSDCNLYNYFSSLINCMYMLHACKYI